MKCPNCDEEMTAYEAEDGTDHWGCTSCGYDEERS